MRDPRHGREIPAGRALAKVVRRFFRQAAAALAAHRGLRLPDLSRFIMPMMEACLPVVAAYYAGGGNALMRRVRRRKPPAKREAAYVTVRAKALPEGGQPFIPFRTPMNLFGTMELRFDVFLPQVLLSIQRLTLEFVTETLNTAAVDALTAYARTREELAAGLEQGEALQSLSRRIRGIFDDPHRAFRVATTEASRFMHAGQEEAARQSGVVAGFRWLASSDACFGAGSLVLKQVGESVMPVAIETLRPGDLVVGGSGALRRVREIRAKRHVGRMVRGPGFSATPDHRFLVADGTWRPIGLYASEARNGSHFDFLVAESENVPPALSQVVGLPLVFAGNLRLAVPVQTIAKDDEVEVVNDEINNPSAIHGDLLAEHDSSVSENRAHGDLNVGTLFSPLVIMGHRAKSAAKVVCVAIDPARVCAEPLAAIRTDASNARFSQRVPSPAHSFAVGRIGAFAGAELLPTSEGGEPSRLEFSTASLAFDGGERRDSSVGLEGVVFTRLAAKAGPALDASRECGVGIPTKSADGSSARLTEQAGATPAAKNSRSVSASGELFTALAARSVDASSSGFGVTGEGAESSSAAGLCQITSFANFAREYCHDSIVLRLLTQTSIVGELVYDIEVEEDHCFVLACGLVAHNCDFCQSLDGKVVDMGGVFAVRGRGPYAVIKHPPAHPHCMCALEEVIA